MAPLRVLAVAEKPSVAKELADILSNKSYRTNQGASRFNRLFEFTVPYGGGQCQMTMTSVIGHLMEHEFAEEVHRKWSRCDPVELFTAPIRAQVPEDKQDVKRNLEEAARGRQELHLWLDCDREGEAIGFEVIDVCLAANPRLKVHRARFSALIPRDIFYALAHLVPPDQRQADAVRARTELDLRLGAAFTRLQTLTLQNEFEGLDGIMSYGPCQFPTMWFVVQRAKRIEAFVQETFWQIELDHKKRAELSSEEEASAVFTWARRRLFDRQSALVLYELCVERRVAVVTSVNGHEKKRWRPTPLSTVELQKEASRRLRIPSDRAMEIAERLYQQGYLSYPRTETDKFKEGFDLAALVGAQAGNPQWGGFARALQAGGFEWPRDGGHDDQAHPPIHPVKAGDGLGGDEARLYEYVARRFLACCSRDALGHETTVKLDLAGEVFSASGLMILEYNYLEVYTYDKWTGRKIPAYYEGEQLEPTALHLREGRTSAPDPLTEPDLISLMDEQGIGTDATIAEHIKKILDRGYAQKCPRGHFFLPLPLARALLDGYVPLGFDLGVPSLRAEMERDMGAVVAGALSRQHAIDKTVRTMRPLYLKAAANLHHLRSAAAREFGRADASRWPVRPMDDGSSPRCGTCGGGMTLRARPAPNGGAELRVLHCAACRQHHSLPAAGGLSSHAHRCPLCGFQVLEVTNRDTGKTHTVCPSCFKKPPAQAGKAAGGEMRCFSCTANCVLAGGAVPVRPCPKCRRGEVLFSRRKDASAVLECNGAAGCLRLYLPGGTALTKHDAQPCGWCGQPLLSFSFARRGLPAHLFHQSYDACCFCCHRHLHEVLQLSNDSAEGTKNVDLLCVATPQGQHAGGGAAGGGGGGFGGGGGCGGGGGLRGGQGGRAGRGGEAGSSFSGTVPTVDLEDLETSAALAAFNGLRGVDTRRGGRSGGRGGAAAGRGGGGGGGGGGPPPASGDCFKCGQAGHWSRDCPNGGGKGVFNGGGGFGGEPYGGGRGGGLDGKAGAARGGQGGGASASHRGGGRGRGDAGAAGRGGKAGSGAGRGAGSSGSPGPTKRKCSVCNGEGHNKRNCPNK